MILLNKNSFYFKSFFKRHHKSYDKSNNYYLSIRPFFDYETFGVTLYENDKSIYYTTFKKRELKLKLMKEWGVYWNGQY